MTQPSDQTDPTPQPSGGADPATGHTDVSAGLVADPRGERVASAVKTWQRHLVDLGGRNTLLWYRDLPSGTLDLTTAHPGGVSMLIAGRPTKLSDLVREPAALGEARRRARTIRAKTLELSEERGIAAGFIAIGMATWTVRGTARPPAAPVLLRSCVLKPTGAAQDDFSLDLGNDVEFNPVLEHYLRSEKGLEFDPQALEDLANGPGGFDPYPVYAELSRLCASVPDFEVAPRLVMGTFSYAKLPMVADLAAQGASLADHDVVAALAGDPGALRAVRATVPESPADADPAREHLILDADSTQQAAIDAVRSGAHLVIKGPPGTGKSQTIANLIASLTGEGKRVLFVAEKRAAIDAVLTRLDRVGLSDLVLDAYDGATNKRRLAQQFGAALERGSQMADPDTTEVEQTLVDRRTRLVEHADALHAAREPWKVSAHQAQNAIATLGARRRPPISRVRIRGEQLAGLDRARIGELGRQLTEAASLGAWSTDDGTDPWYGARIETSEEAVRARDITSRLSQGALKELADTMREVFAEVSLPEAERVSDWGVVLGTVGRVRDTLEVFRPEVFDIPLGDLVAATGTKDYREANGVALGWYSRWRLRRQARDLLRPGTPPADLHAALVDAQAQRVAWQQMAGAGGRPEIPVDLDRARSAYDAVAADLQWLGGRLASAAAKGDLLHAAVAELEARMEELAGRPERLAVIPQVIGTLDALRAAGMGSLLDDLARRGVEADDVAAELDFVWWTSLAEDLTVRDPRYGAHDGDNLRRVWREYVAADHAHLKAGADRVKAAAGRRLREVLADHPEQESLVRAEAGKARRHRPLRDMLPRAAETLTAVKPAWAMSPLVVASILPPGRWFDVVIFDEASQIPPAQAVSAISRASQVVVAGDERQLPPTSFFTSAVDEEAAPDGETLTEGFESVLDVLAAALPMRRLNWHYRSLDERLVAFANREMYDGSLVTFPGAGSEPVLRLDAVDGSGVVQPGAEAIESTEAEVNRVVELVLHHARTRPQESLGVIALGIKHANRLEEALRRALAQANGVGAFFDEEVPERFFIKNLERVQGDERDAIILSIGYGKTPHGRVLHRFGPLNLEGGERRLNVAITRARRRMTVVSSLTSADLDPARLKARGAVMLRDFLAYAESGGAAAASTPVTTTAATLATSVAPYAAGQTGAEPLLTDFARRLQEAGFVAHERYGCSAHPIDLAVEDPKRPGHVLVAVEMDGPSYAAIKSTRDRDRLRVEQLGRLGWEHVRVWSTDLFRDPARDVARVIGVVQRASAEAAEAADAASAHEAASGSAQSASSEPARQEPVHSASDTGQAAAGEAAVTGPDEHADPGPEAGFRPTEDEGARKRRLLRRKPKRAPEQTKDDTDAGWGEYRDGDAHDRWLQEQRPPHWGQD